MSASICFYLYVARRSERFAHRVPRFVLFHVPMVLMVGSMANPPANDRIILVRKTLERKRLKGREVQGLDHPW